MKSTLGIILFAIFAVLSAIHFYWGFGGKSGQTSAVPTIKNGDKLFSPGILSCFAVAFGLSAFGICSLIKADLLSTGLPNWLITFAVWGISLIFILRAIGEFKYVGFFKKIKNTKFAEIDAKFYSPLCLLIGTLAMVLALQN